MPSLEVQVVVSGNSPSVMSQWRENLWSAFVRLESTSERDDFYGFVVPAIPETSRLTTVSSTHQLTERTYGNLRSDPQEFVLLSLQLSGYCFVEQDDRQARLDAGDFAIYETNRPYRLAMRDSFEQLIFRLPRDLLDQRLPSLSRLTARRYAGHSASCTLVSGFLRQLCANAPALGENGLASFEIAAADLIATAIQVESRGTSDPDAIRFEKLQIQLLRDLRAGELNFDGIATRNDMSVRTLQRLFQLHGTTPGKWVLDRRLAGIAGDLCSPAQRNRSVTDIALSWGFSDLSHFYRAFRLRYGVNPGQWRIAKSAH
jgi:AraC-like DNA-binding protein